MEKQVLDFTVLIEQDEDGIYVATVPDIPGEADKEKVEQMKFIGIHRIQIKKPSFVSP